MAKATTPQQAPADLLPLNEFCVRLSADDRRVELIAAFEHYERVRGRLKDSAAAYAGRYKSFANKPV